MSDLAIEIRRATPEDDGAVLDLLELCLGWDANDPTKDMFTWKHMDNVFGRSPAWVAVAGDRVVGYRTFMRWRFRWEGAPVDAVRAVDTATHPDFRGRGLFRLLTMGALDDLRADGVAFVFNTPNDQSRPGYLKMGWRVVGRLPVAARPRGPGGLLRMAGARQPADLWSQPCAVGLDPAEFFASSDRPSLPAADGARIVTDRDSAYLVWRYGFAPMNYRVWADDSSGAVLVFRLRRRGLATELAMLETFGRPRARVITRLLSATRANYAIGLGGSRPRPGLPLANQGPLLTWRALALDRMPPLRDWSLVLGDLELF